MQIQFEDLGISDAVVRAMREMGWELPTPIQVEAIPCGLGGSDMLAQAQTGTGKTGTYGAIALDRNRAGGRLPSTLVVVPTRELALQVAEELGRLSRHTGHRCVPIYGGASMEKQNAALDAGADILVATPGRLKDHLQSRPGLLSGASVVVLDEADRMLDMGFVKDIDYLLSKVPERRQTMLFSATMSKDIRKLAFRHLTNPKELFVSRDEPVLDLISQRYMEVEKPEKIDMLRYILAEDDQKTIVFCFTKHKVDQVVRKLRCQFSVAGIHGDHAQNRRERTIRAFKDGGVRILVASDIAARGLDIDNVTRVVNLDLPLEPETYVHRIGRTGRAGKRGTAVSFVMPDERPMLGEIQRLTGIPLDRMERPGEAELQEVLSSLPPAAPPAQPATPKKDAAPAGGRAMVSAEINLGAADGYGKATISRLISDATDIPKKSVGAIVPGERSSKVEIERAQLARAMEQLSARSVAGRQVRLTAPGEGMPEPRRPSGRPRRGRGRGVKGARRAPSRTWRRSPSPSAARPGTRSSRGPRAP